MENQLEFKKGDVIYWKGWEAKPIKAKVIEAKLAAKLFSDDEEPSYIVEGIDKPLRSVTNGRSIVSSRHFRDYPAIKDDAFDSEYKSLDKEYHKYIKPGFAWKALHRRELED